MCKLFEFELLNILGVGLPLVAQLFRAFQQQVSDLYKRSQILFVLVTLPLHSIILYKY